MDCMAVFITNYKRNNCASIFRQLENNHISELNEHVFKDLYSLKEL